MKAFIDAEFSNVPVAVNAGGDTRGGYTVPNPPIVPIEGEAGQRPVRRLNMKKVKELALIRLYEVSDTTVETSINEDFGDRSIIVSLEITSWESKARLWELYLEIRRIVNKRKRTPGGNYRAVRPRDKVSKVHEVSGTWQYIYDIELVKFGDYLGHI